MIFNDRIKEFIVTASIHAKHQNITIAMQGINDNDYLYSNDSINGVTIPFGAIIFRTGIPNGLIEKFAQKIADKKRPVAIIDDLSDFNLSKYLSQNP